MPLEMSLLSVRYSPIRLRAPLTLKHTSVDRIDVTVAKLG
jgi:hypothetical protein